MYKSLTAQTIHYFARPHERVLRQPLQTAAAWKSSELGLQDEWRETLTAADVAEIERALAAAKRTARPLRTLTKEQFPLPTLSDKIARWRREVSVGRGFQVIRGLPVARWSQSDSEMVFWCIGQHFGIPGAQNPEADLLGHVRDTGADPDEVRHYRTNVNINFHCDAADVVGLLCLHEAKWGGQSRIVSSVSVYNEFLRQRPDLIDRLYEPFAMDTKGEGGVQYLLVRPCRFDAGRLRTFYHTDYFRSALDFGGRPMLSEGDRLVLDLYNEIAGSPDLYLDMSLEPGDVQFLSNHTVLHARTAYEDHAEPELKRHLLRLWISLPSRSAYGSRLRTVRSRLAMIATAVGLKVMHAIRRRSRPA
ncbi:MAG: TauD/TfdA family dioxygenase [Polyangiales bacterium]